jgi:geranylgeranyl pyrophosphate synthase
VAVNLLFAGSHFIASLQPAHLQGRVARLFSEAGSQSAFGQHLSLAQDYGGMAPGEALEAYWRSLILKSGSIFRVAAAAGAAMGTDDESLIETMADYGTCLGVLLQVLDDCRDLLDDPVTPGNQVYLPLLLHALATNSDQIVFPQDHSSAALNKILEEAGVPALLSTILLEWRQRALNSLQPLNPSPAKDALEQIVTAILQLAPSPSA